MNLRFFAHRLHAARLERGLVDADTLPQHIGVIMHGNRLWARAAGFDNASLGHRYGGEHLEDLLRWCGADHR